jgi:hypothetical protein
MLTTTEPIALANALRPILLQLNRQLRRELAPLGITAGQAALLHAIGAQPGIGVRALAQREGVSAPAMSGYVDRLAAAGLVRAEGTKRRSVRYRVRLVVYHGAHRSRLSIRPDHWGSVGGQGGDPRHAEHRAG